MSSDPSRSTDKPVAIGLMYEDGIVIPKGVPQFRKVVVDNLESE